MLTRRTILFLIFLFSITHSIVKGQSHNLSGLFKNDFNRAEMLFEERKYVEAIPLYKKVISKKPGSVQAKLKLAESYRMLKNMTEAEFWYNKSFEQNTDIPAKYKLHYAEVLLTNGHKAEAGKWLEAYHKQEEADEKVKALSKSIHFYDDFLRDSLTSTISETSVNSEYSDFYPLKYNNGLLFLSSRKEDQEFIQYVNASDQSSFLSLYYWAPGDSVVSPAEKFTVFDHSYHDGPLTFFENGNKVIYSRNLKTSSKNNVLKLGLYYSEKISGSDNWTKGELLPFIDPSNSYSHPYFDERSNTLYFVSDIPGGYGATDLYKIQRKDGEWQTPENLGAKINTKGNDLFPFLSSDTCLYFASNGHPGMGGLDLYKVDLKDKDIVVENLGFPANSSHDDFALIVEKDKGYFSSNRKHGDRDDDIYEIEFHKAKLKIKVVERLRSVPQKDARVEVIEESNARKTRQYITNADGEISCFIKPGRIYKVIVHLTNYRQASAKVFVNSKDEEVFSHTIVLEKDNRSFVRGKVINESDSIGNYTVKLIDFYSNSTLVVQTDSTGSFTCEINTDTTNLFYIEKEGLKGIARVEASKRKRKGSGISYIKLNLGEITMKTCKGILLDTAGVAMPNNVLLFKNELNEEELTLTTDDKGEFSAELWENGLYSVYLKANDFVTSLGSFIPERNEQLVLRKSKSEYPVDFDTTMD